VLGKDFLGAVVAPVTEGSLGTMLGIEEHELAITGCISWRCIPPGNALVRCICRRCITQFRAPGAKITELMDVTQVLTPGFESFDLLLETL